MTYDPNHDVKELATPQQWRTCDFEGSLLWADNSAGAGHGYAKTFVEIDEHFIGCSSYVSDPETFCDRGMKLVIKIQDPSDCDEHITVYADGKAVGGGCAPPGGVPTGDDFGGAKMTLGCSEDSEDACLHGEIGNLQLFNEVLTPQNLQAIDTPFPTPGPPCEDYIPEGRKEWKDSGGGSCQWYAGESFLFSCGRPDDEKTCCEKYGDGHANFGRTAKGACCTCGPVPAATETDTGEDSGLMVIAAAAAAVAAAAVIGYAVHRQMSKVKKPSSKTRPIPDAPAQQPG